MENTYWNGNGKYQAEFDELLDLMPGSGKSDVVAGELIRAANRLAYDFYNNGMGNNTSGAINFLDYYGVLDMDRTNIFGKIYEYTRGRIYHGNYNGDELQTAIESMIDMTVEFIQANPHLKTQIFVARIENLNLLWVLPRDPIGTNLQSQFLVLKRLINSIGLKYV